MSDEETIILRTNRRITDLIYTFVVGDDLEKCIVKITMSNRDVWNNTTGYRAHLGHTLISLDREDEDVIELAIPNVSHIDLRHPGFMNIIRNYISSVELERCFELLIRYSNDICHM